MVTNELRLVAIGLADLELTAGGEDVVSAAANGVARCDVAGAPHHEWFNNGVMCNTPLLNKTNSFACYSPLIGWLVTCLVVSWLSRSF